MSGSENVCYKIPEQGCQAIRDGPDHFQGISLHYVKTFSISPSKIKSHQSPTVGRHQALQCGEKKISNFFKSHMTKEIIHAVGPGPSSGMRMMARPPVTSPKP